MLIIPYQNMSTTLPQSKVRVFSSSGLFVSSDAGFYLVVGIGGGGGGGRDHGSGGGSGEFCSKLVILDVAQEVPVLVGSGGSGLATGDGPAQAGQPTEFGTFLACDPGQGGARAVGGGASGGAGGSGGGAAPKSSGGANGSDGVSSGSFLGGVGQGLFFQDYSQLYILGEVGIRAGNMGSAGYAASGGGGGIVYGADSPSGETPASSNPVAWPPAGGGEGYGGGGGGGLGVGSLRDGGRGAPGLLLVIGPLGQA